MIQRTLQRQFCTLLGLATIASSHPSGDPAGIAIGTGSNHTTWDNDDVHSGVSDVFNVALHNPTIALNTPGSQIGISCPAALKWNEQYIKNSTTEEMTDDEREQAWIVSYMDKHPDKTLWELFTNTLHEDVKAWVEGPHPVEKAADAVVEFTADVIKDFIMMVWGALKWIVKFPFQSKKEWKQVKDLGHELWDGSKIAAQLFENNPIDGFKTVTGGLFLHLLLHGADFTAESILLVGAGFQVIHGLIHGVEMVAGTLPPIVGKGLMSVLWFIHSLDDPLLILTPIFTNTAQALQAGKGGITVGTASEENGGFTSDDGSNLVTLPPETVLPASKKCPLLSPDLGAPPLTYSKLCLSEDPSQVRQIIFGTPKPSDQLTREERLKAFSHVQKFWCCYGNGENNSIPLPDAILDDIPGREQWEGKAFWKSIDFDCQKIFDANPTPSGGRLNIGL